MTQFVSRLVTCVFFFNNVVHRTNGDVIVNTTVGQIRGYRATDGDYKMFMGIPYAVVNSSNPFGAAIAFPTFEGVFEANNDSAICPQKEEYNNTVVGSLDCLHVNIYVPNAETSKPLAVILWIFGGKYVLGFPGRYVYGPSYFMKQNVILVTINYRLGPYGFMCLDTPQVPGNQGLKDQLLGMEWVKNNIDAFGGDPNKITVAGHSAGGMSIELHILSDKKKLYDQIIIQSGSSYCPSFKKPIKKAPFLLANHFGRTFGNINEAISFLATVNPLQVIQAGYDLNLTDSFGPCVEVQMDGIDQFMTENWLWKNEMPKIKNKNILIGNARDEKLFSYVFKNADDLKDLKTMIKNRLVLSFDITHEDFIGMSETMQNFYLKDFETDKSKIRHLSEFDSDFSFLHPTHRSLLRYLKNSARSMYLYEFAYMGMRNLNRRRLHALNVPGGAIHADEVGYLFDVEYLSIPNTKDQLVIDMMTTMWANFAKYGDPTPQTTTLLPVKWLPITNGSQYPYLVIDSELTVGSRPYHKRMAFWDVFCKANSHLQRLYPDDEAARL